MKKSLLMLVLILSFLSFQTISFGKEMIKGIQGELTAVNVEAASLQILPEDQTDKKENINVIVLKDTQFNGFDSLTELKIGDEVSAELQRNEKTGLWEARSIAITKVKLRDTVL